MVVGSYGSYDTSMNHQLDYRVKSSLMISEIVIICLIWKLQMFTLCSNFLIFPNNSEKNCFDTFRLDFSSECFILNFFRFIRVLYQIHHQIFNKRITRRFIVCILIFYWDRFRVKIFFIFQRINDLQHFIGSDSRYLIHKTLWIYIIFLRFQFSWTFSLFFTQKRSISNLKWFSDEETPPQFFWVQLLKNLRIVVEILPIYILHAEKSVTHKLFSSNTIQVYNLIEKKS